MTVSDTGEQADRTVSRRALGWTIAVVVGLVAWFFIVWLAMGRTMIDAAGESIGTGLVILLVTSIVGSARRNKQD